MQAVNACIAAMRMSHCQPVNICRHCSMPVTRCWLTAGWVDAPTSSTTAKPAFCWCMVSGWRVPGRRPPRPPCVAWPSIWVRTGSRLPGSNRPPRSARSSPHSGSGAPST
jgi:hypothetical protein